MPAAVISIGTRTSAATPRAWWSLLQLALPGRPPSPYGILLVDQETGDLTLRLRDAARFEDLDEPESDILATLARDLEEKGREMGGLRLLDWLEDSLSNFLRIGDRAAVACADAHAVAGRLFDEHVDLQAEIQADDTVRPFVTHLPVYGLRAAATKFGEGMDAALDGWVRAPENLRLTQGMFVAHVVGRSMEPLIPDGSACIFRAPVTGSRKGRFLLIENFGETDFASRYTVKRYGRQGLLDESAEREQPIRLEPLNRDFDAFELTGDGFRVVAEFVQVLPS